MVDSSSVRAKRGGELTGPNPTDRGKAGTKYHVVASTDGLPLGAVPSAANVHDTRLFPHLLRLAQVVCAAIGRLYAEAAYASADNRRLCRQDGIQPFIREVGEPHGSGLGAVRCVVEHDCAWLLANKRLDRRQDRLGRIILALLTAACIFIIANRLQRILKTTPKRLGGYRPMGPSYEEWPFLSPVSSGGSGPRSQMVRAGPLKARAAPQTPRYLTVPTVSGQSVAWCRGGQRARHPLPFNLRGGLMLVMG